ncbi:PaaX family transcriptional regulator [Flavobacterium limnosediminis JC2902]|uniref:PaaX family transcriptional regulator n=1 Tax=Flavobacterium limnosediminis JC2902 TaxID=1341181 RepID=V6SL07_9FLAO|nr:PaaX family transcriptional regulator [Flavobacterium limnosediminis]ESU27271.1 PaaX family transcriptional regulator [Flavobacterium limnosediminis JC2902]
MLDTLITSKTRVRLLVKFFMNVANEGYLRGLAEEFNESTNAIRKELNHLTEAGYLEKEAIQNKITYKANSRHPLFDILQKMVRQHLGLDAIVEMILDRMGDVQKVMVIGDYAKGKDSGIIEVVIVGAALNTDYIDQLAGKIEQEIGRKVVFYVKGKFEGAGMTVYAKVSM